MAQVIAVVSDLILASRVEGSLRAAGHQVNLVGSLPGDLGDAAAIVCDLEIADAIAVGAATVPSLGFYSHVDIDSRRRALDAGIDLVVPRSRMSRELPALVERLIAADD